MAAAVADRIYVHQLNLTSADVVRRQREKEMVEEEARKVRERRDIRRRQREEEKKRDMEMLVTYNPWGKPGGGNKGDELKRTKNLTTEMRQYPIEGEDEEETLPVEGFMQKFGRPGHGAPNRTDSGKIKTQITGDPAIRFQDTQLVRLSIENQLRYKKEDKENYRKHIDELIEHKQKLQQQEKFWEEEKIKEMRELYPFGRDLDNDPMFMPTRPKKIIFKDEDFNPWGKGFGNPSWDRRGNVQRHNAIPPTKTMEEGVPDLQYTQLNTPNAELGIGRSSLGGNGAPHLTESGHPRTKLKNTLNNIKSMGPHIDDASYNPWGKPGGGAPFQREGDGKIFEEKLGWSMNGHKRTKDAKDEYRKTLQQEIEERNWRKQKEKLEIREPIVRIRPPQRMTKRVMPPAGVDVATIITRGVGGRPAKDPVTGELLPNHRKLTDVTAERLDIRRSKSQETLWYHDELTEQAAQREQLRQRQKMIDKAQAEKHVITWDSFWGRPGHGAPKDPNNHKKENIVALLEGKTAEPYVKRYLSEYVSSKHNNSYEAPTQDVLAIKRNYEFRTPYPATEV